MGLTPVAATVPGPHPLPRYLDGLLAAHRAGRAGRCVHLGWWATPPDAAALAEPGAFQAAQQRLNAQLLAMAAIGAGHVVADVGCGLGATLAAVDTQCVPVCLLGINIDHRQLAVCRQLRPRPGNTMAWLQADATALPLASGSVDRLLCIEAMFHFDSRAAFFREAARVLRPGGRLVCSDIVRRGPVHADDAAEQALAADVLAGFGPWPEFGRSDIDHADLAAAAGLHRLLCTDATAATLPSHHYTAPSSAVPRDPVARACAALAALHRSGRLAYPLMAFDRAGGNTQKNSPAQPPCART